MGEDAPGRRRQTFITLLQAQGVGLAYFFGSRKDLGPILLDGEEVAGAPARDPALAPRFAIF